MTISRRTILKAAAVAPVAAAAGRVRIPRRRAAGLYTVNYFPAKQGGPEMWSGYSHATISGGLTRVKNFGFNCVRVQLAANTNGLGWPSPSPAYVSALQDFYITAQGKGISLHISNFDLFGGLYTQTGNSQTWIAGIISAFRGADSSLAGLSVIETHNEAFAASDQSQWPAVLTWVKAVTAKIRSLVPGIPVTTSVPSGQGTSGGGLGFYFNGVSGTADAPDFYDYHLYGSLGSIASQLQTAISVVTPAPLRNGEFGWDVEGSTNPTQRQNQANYAQDGRFYCDQLGLPEPGWWQLNDVTGSEFTAQFDGLRDGSGSLTPAGQVYVTYPPGTVPPHT